MAEAHSSVLQGELPASTLIVVKGLFHPDFLIEIEGVAALDVHFTNPAPVYGSWERELPARS